MTYCLTHRDHHSGQDPNEIVQRHIKLLHTYNEIKDGSQRLIGAVSHRMSIYCYVVALHGIHLASYAERSDPTRLAGYADLHSMLSCRKKRLPACMRSWACRSLSESDLRREVWEKEG
jgi:hypothetical protein